MSSDGGKEAASKQEEDWIGLKKRIDEKIDKVTEDSIQEDVVELFKENIQQGRGLVAESVIRQGLKKDPDLYASLVSILNSKIPEIGSLVVRRLVYRYKHSQNKSQKLPILILISQLVNYEVCSEILLLQILVDLLKEPNDANVELALPILTEAGAFLNDTSKPALAATMEQIQTAINEGLLSSTVQGQVEKVVNLRKRQFKGHSAVKDELDLVEDEDKVTHTVKYEDVDPELSLNEFHYDPEYALHNAEYERLQSDILGSDSEESETYSEEPNEPVQEIRDLTDQELTNFQKKVYLTIMGSMGPEEAAHKLLLLPAIDQDNKEKMLVDMIVKCCAQEKLYSKFYGLIGEGLIGVSPKWEAAFNQVFEDNYKNCHRFEPSLLRNIGSFWGHMFASDRMGWEPLKTVKLTQDDTDSSQRILLKFVFSKMLEELGMDKLEIRVEEPYIKKYLNGMFPESGDPEHLRFAINYFTALGLGRLTEKMRESLEAIPERGRSHNRSGSESSYSSSSSYSRSRSGSYSSSSRSRTPSESPERRQPSSQAKRPPSRSSSRSPVRKRGNRVRRGRGPASNANRVPLGRRRN